MGTVSARLSRLVVLDKTLLRKVLFEISCDALDKMFNVGNEHAENKLNNERKEQTAYKCLLIWL